MITARAYQLRSCHICYRVVAPALTSATIYIGACALIDLHRLPDARVNSEWKRLIKDDMIIDITIIASFRTAELAQAMALTCATVEKPWFNANGTTVGSAANRGPATRVRCIATDMIYKTATAAANDMGVSQAAMSAHLNGKSRTVRGMVFERIV